MAPPTFADVDAATVSAMGFSTTVDLPDKLQARGKTALGLIIIGLVLAAVGAILGFAAGKNAAKAKGFKIGFAVLSFFSGAFVCFVLLRGFS
jgi:hypothetical protein